MDVLLGEHWKEETRLRPLLLRQHQQGQRSQSFPFGQQRPCSTNRLVVVVGVVGGVVVVDVGVVVGIVGVGVVAGLILFFLYSCRGRPTTLSLCFSTPLPPTPQPPNHRPPTPTFEKT